MAGDARETGSANLVLAFQGQGNEKSESLLGSGSQEEKWMWTHGRRNEFGGKKRSRISTCLHSFSENPETRRLRSCVVVSLAA